MKFYIVIPMQGILSDGTIIAVKQLSSKSKQGNREFVNEIGMISGLQHPNLVKLYGCCIEGNQLLLIYEYMENNSLARALFGKLYIDCFIGNVFLRQIQIHKIILNRRGYMAPEYALWGYLTYKADVYSFGVLALEIVAGKNNMKYRPNEDYVCLLDCAFVLQQRGSLMELVDPKLGSDFNKEEAISMIKIAILCTNASPALRPTMSTVVSMLEGQTVVQELISDPSIYGDDSRFKALREHYNQMQIQSSSETTQTQNNSSNATWIGSSSTTAQDLYRINPDSQSFSRGKDASLVANES
ncbi:hypothetical protein HHK36_005208 [Tetracentron sinense]|uniref:Protein kinase domain-containing protein n=1 Tax=Tetracentron sinense TaxID=13715 RepID=A0A834ZP21_TETSI|nr:hypothetical protein HHK36_005208 [Tetracentron sinense]